MAWNPSDSKRKEMPASCFLKPSERKYPYKVYKGGQWVVSASQLKAAISCANSANDPAIAKKASGMLARLKNKK